MLDCVGLCCGLEGVSGNDLVDGGRGLEGMEKAGGVGGFLKYTSTTCTPFLGCSTILGGP